MKILSRQRWHEFELGDIVTPIPGCPNVPPGAFRVTKFEGGWTYLENLDSGERHERIPDYWLELDVFLTECDRACR